MSLPPAERAALLERFAQMGAEAESGMTPLYAAIGRSVAQHPEVLDVYDRLEPARRRAVLLLAAVHYLVLDADGSALGRIYAAGSSRAALDEVGDAFLAFVDERSDEIAEVMQERSVQTNEVNRCVALLPVLMEVARSSGRAPALIELGASAGLNLLFDRFRYDYVGGPVLGQLGATVRLSTELRGRVPKLDPAMPFVQERIGIDLAPIDVDDEDSVRWLRACVWAGDVARDQRLSAAVDLARRERPDVRVGNAIDALVEVAGEVPADRALCVFDSWMVSWLAQEDRARLAGVVAELARARPVWWATLEESDGVPGLPDVAEVPGDASVLGLQRIDGEDRDARVLAVVQHHGKWIDWLDEATTAW